VSSADYPHQQYNRYTHNRNLNYTTHNRQHPTPHTCETPHPCCLTAKTRTHCNSNSNSNGSSIGAVRARGAAGRQAGDCWPPKLHDGCISRSCTNKHTARSAGSHSSVLLLLPMLLTANKTCLMHTTQLARHNPDKPMHPALLCPALSMYVCSWPLCCTAARPFLAPSHSSCRAASAFGSTSSLQASSTRHSSCSLQGCQRTSLQLPPVSASCQLPQRKLSAACTCCSLRCCRLSALVVAAEGECQPGHDGPEKEEAGHNLQAPPGIKAAKACSSLG
jgi:hypothetical protein